MSEDMDEAVKFLHLERHLLSDFLNTCVATKLKSEAGEMVDTAAGSWVDTERDNASKLQASLQNAYELLLSKE